MAFGTYAPMVGAACDFLPDPFKGICSAAVAVGGALDPVSTPGVSYVTAPITAAPTTATTGIMPTNGGADPTVFGKVENLLNVAAETFMPGAGQPPQLIGSRTLIPVAGARPLSQAEYATDYTGACPTGKNRVCIKYNDVAGFAQHLLMRGYVPAETPTGQVLRMKGHPFRRIKVCIESDEGRRVDMMICVVPLKKSRKQFRITRARVQTTTRTMRALASQQKLAGRLKDAAKCLVAPRKAKKVC